MRFAFFSETNKTVAVRPKKLDTIDKLVMVSLGHATLVATAFNVSHCPEFWHTFLFTSHAMDWNLRTIELTQKKEKKKRRNQTKQNKTRIIRF